METPRLSVSQLASCISVSEEKDKKFFVGVHFVFRVSPTSMLVEARPILKREKTRDNFLGENSSVKKCVFFSRFSLTIFRGAFRQMTGHLNAG